MITVRDIEIGPGLPLAVIAGPCVIEGEDDLLFAAEKLVEICARHAVPMIFCSSYDKANRTALSSYRGPGIEEGLRMLSKIRETFDVPINTDVHTPTEARTAGTVCDSIQIPAFLCRQTDLIVAAAESGKPVLVKKGQFMAPWDMESVVKKIGHKNVILMDRGTSFGYNNLVSDFRSIPVMHSYGVPVCFDGTHSVQLPGGHGSHSGGQRQFVAPLCRAAVAAGADCLYIEAHPEPARAKSDAATQLDFEAFDELLPILKDLRTCLGAHSSSLLPC